MRARSSSDAGARQLGVDQFQEVLHVLRAELPVGLRLLPGQSPGDHTPNAVYVAGCSGGVRCGGHFRGGEALGAEGEAGAIGLGGLPVRTPDEPPVGEGPSAVEQEDVVRGDVPVQPALTVGSGEDVDEGHGRGAGAGRRGPRRARRAMAEQDYGCIVMTASHAVFGIPGVLVHPIRAAWGCRVMPGELGASSVCRRSPGRTHAIQAAHRRRCRSAGTRSRRSCIWCINVAPAWERR